MDEPIEGQVELSQVAQAEDSEAKAKAARVARLDALGASLAIKRKEAIEYRRRSGIETEWDEDDDAYEGVDSASKDKSASTRPVGQITPKVEGETKSTIVLNVTKPYVNAFASKIIDMRLATDDRAWALKPTPVPLLMEMEQSDQSVMLNGETVAEKDVAKDIMAEASKRAEKAQKRIDDWMVEGRWHAEGRQVADDMARIGTGVMKGPFPEKGKSGISPKSKRISARNLFPDPACGENVHDGDYIWERDYLTSKRLGDLKDQGYIAEQIDAVLDEGPRLPEVDYSQGSNNDPDQKSRPYQLWYYTGNLNVDDIEAAGCGCGETDRHETYPVVVTMVNDRVIKAALNPLGSGKFAYDVAPCSRREGHWAGIGIGRELRTPQRMITGAVRQMMENAGLSSGPQIVIRRGVLEPSDGNYTITPRKIWYVAKDADVQQVQHAFQLFNIDSRQQELMAIIQFALKMCEDVTGLPMILQGQQGKAPDVLGVVQILNENATSVARRVAKMYDDNLIEPQATGYYDWLMEYSEDDSEKGDATIDVLTPPDVMADKKAIADMIQFAQHPQAKVDMAKLFAEVAKSNRFDPTRIQYSDADWEKISQQKPPQDPRVQVAELSAQVKALAMKFEAGENQKDREHEMLVEAIQAELARSEQAGDQVISLEKIKGMLGSTAIKEKNRRDIYAAEQALKLRTGQGI